MSHYYDPDPAVASRPVEIPYRFDTQDFRFESDRGVFSRSSIDAGTDRLLRTMAADLRARGFPEGDPEPRLLDLGCGYGPVGIVLKRLFPFLSVVLSDLNGRALDLARRNAAQNGVRYAEFLQSDGFERIPGTFSLVATNPPIRAGKPTVHRFFQGAWERLRPGGRLYVVIRKQQGAPSARRTLEALFGNCRLLDRDAGYHVLVCEKTHAKEERT